MSVNRRKFLSIGAILGSFPFLNLRLDDSVDDMEFASNAEYFLCSSGNLRSEDFLGYGLLRYEANSKQFSRYIEEARQLTDYRSTINFSSSDKYKKQICKLLIDNFITDPELSFSIKVIENPATITVGMSPLERINYRIAAYNELLTGYDENNATIKVKSESPFGPSKSFNKKVEDKTDGKFKIKPLKNYEDDILQFTGLITGCIIADFRGNTRNVVKVEILDYLKEKLGVTNFTIGQNINNKINII